MFSLDREAPAPRREHPLCSIFQWVGQSWNHCNDCGKSVHLHLYHPPYGNQKPIFHVKTWRKWQHQWVWLPVGSLNERVRS